MPQLPVSEQILSPRRFCPPGHNPLADIVLLPQKLSLPPPPSPPAQTLVYTSPFLIPISAPPFLVARGEQLLVYRSLRYGRRRVRLHSDFLETGTYPSGHHKAQKRSCGGNVRTMRSIAAYCTAKRKRKEGKWNFFEFLEE